MTDKWADYCVTAVRFNEDRKHIDRIKQRQDNGDKLGATSESTRADVVKAIEDDITYVTAVKNSDGQYKKGKPVFITEIGGVKYLKTVANDTPVDNLDNLPEF